MSKETRALEIENMELVSSKDSLNKELKSLKDEVNENTIKLDILKKSHHEEIEELKDRYGSWINISRH